MSPTPQKTQLPTVDRIIGIVSGKGGVGKTFVAANLGIAMAKLGKRVGILDADVSYPNLFKMMGMSSKLIPNAENKIMPPEKFGVKAVSMAGLTASEDEPVMWRGPIISKIIQQLLRETLWGELDVLLIDFPSGTTDAAITILQNFVVDACMVVTSPQMLSTLDARKTINAMALLEVPLLGVVENMRGEVFGEGGGNRLADYYRTQLLGSIPLRKNVVTCCDQGTPAVLNIEEMEMIFTRIARGILEKIPARR